MSAETVTVTCGARRRCALAPGGREGAHAGLARPEAAVQTGGRG